MAGLIKPRRDESIVNDAGIPTTRFSEYLELNTSQTVESTSETEISTETINLSVGSQAKMTERVNENENAMVAVLSQRKDHMTDILYLSLSGKIANLQKQIDELRTLVN